MCSVCGCLLILNILRSYQGCAKPLLIKYRLEHDKCHLLTVHHSVGLNHKINAMYVEQIYTKCLSEASYYIESKGEAAIIDPMRDVALYLELAKKRSATIRYVFETHFNADFVSGHAELAGKTGATIVYGPTSQVTGFKALIAEDSRMFNLGEITIAVLHTPGIRWKVPASW